MRVKQHRLNLAFGLSLLLHILGVLLFGALAGVTIRALRVPAPKPPAESIVTLSDALTISKRAHPVPQAPTRPHPPPPVVALAPRVELPPARPRVETLPLPHLPRIPVMSVAAPRPAAPTKPVLSATQIEHLDRDFARTIAQAHAAHDPLNVPTAAPAAPKRYHLEFQGIFGDLHEGQGILTPIRSWRAEGYVYYYLTYQFMWADGTYESGAVPWPVRYLPADDPFADGTPGERIPLPPPLPGWRLPPHPHLGKVLQSFFSPTMLR